MIYLKFLFNQSHFLHLVDPLQTFPAAPVKSESKMTFWWMKTSMTYIMWAENINSIVFYQYSVYSRCFYIRQRSFYCLLRLFCRNFNKIWLQLCNKYKVELWVCVCPLSLNHADHLWYAAAPWLHMPCLGRDKKTPANIMVKDFQLCSYVVNPPRNLAEFRINWSWPEADVSFMFFYALFCKCKGRRSQMQGDSTHWCN